MRMQSLAAVAVLSLGVGAAETASASTWQESILGNRVSTASAPAVVTPAPAKRAQSTKSASTKSASNVKKNTATVQKASLTSSSTWSSSASSAYQSGIASYYWQPQKVASGGWFNPNAMTAAHKSLPFGTKVRVTNKSNGKSVVVTINDRGPFVAGRIIDLSKAAAGVIGMQGAGLAPVTVAVVGR